MNSDLFIGGGIVIAVLALFKFLVGGNNGDADQAVEAVKEVTDGLRRRLKELKERFAKKKHDDTVDSDLDDWLDDELGPKS